MCLSRNRRLQLPIDPPAGIDCGPLLGHLCGVFTARDDFDVSLLFGKDPPYTHLSVPQAAGKFRVHFDTIAPVLRLDDHPMSVEPTSALDLVTPNEHSGERSVRLVIQQPQARCDSDPRQPLDAEPWMPQALTVVPHAVPRI
jgi:hypothetical protein